VSAVTSLSLVVPAYNEALNVAAFIDEARAAFARLAIPAWEIVFVDDGSTDGTPDVVRDHAAGDTRIRVVSHDVNRGYGAALHTGIAAARHAWVFITDADLQFRIDDLGLLLPLAETCDFVQGHRIRRADRASRVVLGRVFRALVHAIARVPVRDPECSFRLVRASILRDLPIVTWGPLVPVELVHRAARAGAVFGEVGVVHRPRQHGTSSALTLRSLRWLAADAGKLLRAQRSSEKA
jgi:glycosyltransferase involved in cell wall biosynthesis